MAKRPYYDFEARDLRGLVDPDNRVKGKSAWVLAGCGLAVWPGENEGDGGPVFGANPEKPGDELPATPMTDAEVLAVADELEASGFAGILDRLIVRRILATAARILQRIADQI
jgi:hypothetical protein